MSGSRRFSIAVESPTSQLHNKPFNAFLVSSPVFTKTQSLPNLQNPAPSDPHINRMYSICDINNINQINESFRKRYLALNRSTQFFLLKVAIDDISIPRSSNSWSENDTHMCLRNHKRRNSIALKFADPREIV